MKKTAPLWDYSSFTNSFNSSYQMLPLDGAILQELLWILLFPMNFCHHHFY